jgi:retron-type reverse transcriptase
MDQENYTGVLFLDFKKAFDMVNHTILLSKLKVYKLDDLSLNWFRSYLSERFQKVIINNYESSAQNIRYEIPQGSILGPLLFFLYINDLPLYVDHSMSDLYADDTTIYFSSNSISDINIKLNEDMEKVQVGCTSNDMGYKYYEIKINDNGFL